eukprot:Blabericola_migrator_1__2318@NODE_1647_length_4101_cov_110_049331_g449_i1_p1_GENE_NODE_1647_length_4101_cov_110_049331_g449_i1NODE_1647_length_4101_cov_110_049331_g449_i1_p1_ORF_typecomplete_len1335_score146_53Phosphodiest/PF01663_22/0_00013PUNUT/PF16913_5/0_028PUNUT/PF16913_5/7_1e03_NODE_1647_length_4101_cov_110_049331_g449_i194013
MDYSKIEARRFFVNIVLGALTACSIFVYSIFLQYIPTSTFTSHPRVYPSPQLYDDLEHTSNKYCLHSATPVRSWDECDQLLHKGVPEELPRGNVSTWAPAPYRKGILLLLDAWRFDWMIWHPDVHVPNDPYTLPFGSERNKASTETQAPVQFGFNNFPFIHHVMNSLQHRRQGRQFRMLADVPTLTTQRLRGLMCGDVAPFFDLSKSLAGSAVGKQDSLIYQLKVTGGKPLGALGDDTWDRLFGKYLDTVLIDEGFDIHDIETVDDGVHKRLWTILDRTFKQASEINFDVIQDQSAATKYVHPNKTRIYQDYALVVAHMLGMDHIGHSSLINTEALRARHNIYDKMVSNLIYYVTNGGLGYPYFSSARNSTLVNARVQHPNLTFEDHVHAVSDWRDDMYIAVFGDHGMIPSGNHGGSSKLETETAFFFYSPRNLVDEALFYRSDRLSRALPSTTTLKLWNPRDPLLDASGYYSSPFIQSRNYTFRSFDQVDVTATLSLLMGLPIPWDSLGGIIPELFPLYSPNTYWMHERQKTTMSSRDSNGTELVTIIHCGGKEVVTHPLLDDTTECALAFPNSTFTSGFRTQISHEHIVYEGDWRTPTAFTVYRLSRLAWLGHLRFLAQLTHLNSWQIRRRQLEIAKIRTSVTHQADALWRAAKECYTSMILSRCSEACCPSPGSFGLHRRLFGNTNTSTYTLTSLQVEQDIEAVSSQIEHNRAYIYETQDILRQVQSSNFLEDIAKRLALWPLTVIVIIALLWNPYFVVPHTPSLRDTLRQYLGPLLGPLCFSILSVSLLIAVYFDAVASANESPSLPYLKFLRPGSLWAISIWAVVAKLAFALMYGRSGIWVSASAPSFKRKRQHSSKHQHVPLKLKTCLLADFATNVESWYTLVHKTPGPMTWAALVDKIHWLLLLPAALIQFGSGMAIDYQHLSGRLLMQGYCLLLYIKAFHVVVRSKMPADLRSGADRMTSMSPGPLCSIDESGLFADSSPPVTSILRQRRKDASFSHPTPSPPDVAVKPWQRNVSDNLKAWHNFKELIALAFRPELHRYTPPTLHSVLLITRISVPWFLMLLLVRLDDYTCLTYNTPASKIPTPLTGGDYPDIVVVIIILVTALLLYHLFPIETPWENCKRFLENGGLNASPQLAAHFLHHIFFPKDHNKAPARRLLLKSNSNKRVIERRMSGPAGVDSSPLVPLSPTACTSRAFIKTSDESSSETLPRTASILEGPGSHRDQWYSFSYPWYDLVLGFIWICQCIVSSLYFNVVSRLDMTVSNSLGPHSPGMHVWTRLVLLDDTWVAESDPIKHDKFLNQFGPIRSVTDVQILISPLAYVSNYHHR